MVDEVRAAPPDQADSSSEAGSRPSRAVLRRPPSTLGAALNDSRVAVALLVGILVLAGALRFTGLNWDENQHLHPDERFLTMVENSLRWPSSLSEYWDSSTNPLNPYNAGHGTYVYGLLPVAAAKFAGELTGHTGYDGVFLVGRALSGLVDMLSILLVFLIGRRLYDNRVGLVGALLLSLSVLNIQQSHYFTVDNFTTFFVTLALYFAVRVAQGKGWFSFIMLGVAFGLAVSAKISVLTFLLIIGLAYVWRVVVRWRQAEAASQERVLDASSFLGRFRISLTVEPSDAGVAPSRAERLAMQAIAEIPPFAAMMVVAFLVFRIVQPQAFTGPGFFNFALDPNWKANMSYIQRLVGGDIDYPPSHQWTARPAVWYSLENMVLWGLGLPLGLTVWASWGLMGYELYRRKWAHLLPWVWMTFTFFFQSVQFVKTVRYMLPIYPTMALIAGYGLVWLCDRGRSAGQQRPTSRVPWLAHATALGLGGLVVLGTAAWAFAFTSIYTRPVTRIAASRWIYRNLPAGAGITYEVWDDPLPLNVDGQLAHMTFNQVRMDLYWEDVPEKREALYEWLEQADYIALSSNRLYGSIPRLPMRYPMTTCYYEALFSGELGYDRLVTFTSRPRLFGIELVDDDADESFTVYDHPQVIIFQKRADFSVDKVRALFDGYDLERVTRLMPKRADNAPNGLMLSTEMSAAQRRGGTWSSIFNFTDFANRAPTLVWLTLVSVLGIIAFPLGFVALRRLRDRGYVLSKTLGILLVGYLAWLLPSLQIVAYTRTTILGGLAVLAAISLAVAWRQRAALQSYLRARWRLLLVNEVLFLLLFSGFLLIRRANPDLWHPVTGGEKPMDLAYLNAILRSTYFPPYDPWFAGGYINYYYMGLATVATLIKLTGIVPWVAYNLALPTLFALTAMGVSSVVFNLLAGADGGDSAVTKGEWRALRFGLVGALLVAVVGNLGEVQLLFNGLCTLGSDLTSPAPVLGSLARAGLGLWRVLAEGRAMPFRPEWWYWNASRVMQHGEINEFPFFTFLYADLHAHLTALPFTLLAMGLAVGCLWPTRVRPESPECERLAFGAWWRRVDWAVVVRLVLLALVLGQLWTSNTWDYPTYLGISWLALAIGLYAERRRIDQSTVAAFVLRGLSVTVLSYLLFLPFHAHYGAAYSSVTLWKGETTSLAALLVIYLLPLFVLGSYLVAMAQPPSTKIGVLRELRLFVGRRRRRAQQLYNALGRGPSLWQELARIGLGLLVLVLSGLWLMGLWVPLVMLPVLVLACTLGLQPRAHPEHRFAMGLIAVGAALAIAVEFIVLKGDIGRMNTVFKFSLQVWVLWGIACAVALAHLWPRRAAWSGAGRRLWTGALVALLLGVSLYPLFAVYGKIRDRWDPRLPASLDGMQYMTTAHYTDNEQTLTLEHDRRAILWMLDNIQGSPVIVEANTPLYRWGGRVSVYTGLPSVVGWDWHQQQQRAPLGSEVVTWRVDDVRELYNTPDTAVAERILRHYGVEYIYAGELERAYYDPDGLLKFERMVGDSLELAYQDGATRIYRVLEPSKPEAARDETPEVAPRRERRAWHWVPAVVRAEEPPPPGPGEPMMLDRPVDQLPVLRDRGWNRPARDSSLLAAMAWWLTLQLVGLAAWPLVAAMLPGLCDGGYGITKGVGLILVSYLVWLGASCRVLPHSPPAAWGAVLFVGVAACTVSRGWRTALSRCWNRRRGLILLEEGLFTLAFVAFVVIRMLNPDLWQPWFGGEKTMEIAILNALTRSAYMPPYDPYYAGGIINYYYYGHFIVAVLIKLTGTLPEIAFNLAVPTIFGLTISHAFTVGRQLWEMPHTVEGATFDEPSLPQKTRTVGPRGALWAGLGAALFVALLSNLSTPLQLAEQLVAAGGSARLHGGLGFDWLFGVGSGLYRVLTRQASLPPFDYWYQATRIIPYTINEFPFFSTLFADLHPHMISVPFTVLVVALGLGLLVEPSPRPGPGALRWCVLALALGALGVINTWDLPTCTVVVAVILLYRAFRQRGVPGLGRGIVMSMLVAAGALALYIPFYAAYRAQYMRLAFVPGDGRSPLGSFVLIWGTHLFVGISMLFVLPLEEQSARVWTRLFGVARRRGWPYTWKRLRALGGRGYRVGRLALGVLAATGTVVVALALSGDIVLAITLALAVASALTALLSALQRRCSAGIFARWLLVSAGLAVLAGLELIYLEDFLANSEWRRMNTVFKFSMQAWVLLGLGMGSALPTLWRTVASRRPIPSRTWMVLCVGVLAGGLLYPFWAVPARVNERFPYGEPPQPTLDGTAYMQTAAYNWPSDRHVIELRYDYEALQWLLTHVEGTPVIAEAPLGYYREGGLRVSSYTGYPTIIGAHEREQRPWGHVEPRERDAEMLYTTIDSSRAWEVLRRYSVRYIYVGQLERAVYHSGGLSKFEALADAGALTRVYSNPQVTIYQVPYDGAAAS